MKGEKLELSHVFMNEFATRLSKVDQHVLSVLEVHCLDGVQG